MKWPVPKRPSSPLLPHSSRAAFRTYVGAAYPVIMCGGEHPGSTSATEACTRSTRSRKATSDAAHRALLEISMQRALNASWAALAAMQRQTDLAPVFPRIRDECAESHRVWERCELKLRQKSANERRRVFTTNKQAIDQKTEVRPGWSRCGKWQGHVRGCSHARSCKEMVAH